MQTCQTFTVNGVRAVVPATRSYSKKDASLVACRAGKVDGYVDPGRKMKGDCDGRQWVARSRRIVDLTDALDGQQLSLSHSQSEYN
jgi:hypothetical protein